MRKISDWVTTEEFDAFYGKGALDRAMELINALAPSTRRDDWWATPGPYEIIADHMRKISNGR